MQDLHTPLPNWLDLLASKVASLRFGSVQISIHEGKVTQIECHERTRLDLSRSEKSQDLRGDGRDSS